MRRFISILAVIATTNLFSFQIKGVDIWGKVETGPAYIHIDVIEANRTQQKLDLPASRTDAIIIIGQGWNIRPTFTWGKNKSEYLGTGLGFGRCIPWGDKLIFTPLAGFTYSQVLTKINITTSEGFFVGRFQEKFEATAGFAGLECTYIISPCWRASGQAQYAWSHGHTNIKNLLKATSDSAGPIFGAQVEHDFSKKWSMNIGAGWNLSLSKDKNGIRGRGVKIGVARWF